MSDFEKMTIQEKFEAYERAQGILAGAIHNLTPGGPVWHFLHDSREYLDKQMAWELRGLVDPKINPGYLREIKERGWWQQCWKLMAGK